METFARSYVLWPNMNTVITQTVKNCHECQLNANSPTKVPIHPWDWTDKLWVRLDLNYARSYRSKMFLLQILSRNGLTLYLHSMQHQRRHNWEVTYCLCKFCNARINCDGQQQFVYQFRIWDISLAEWNTTTTKSTTCIKCASWQDSSNFQNFHE